MLFSTPFVSCVGLKFLLNDEIKSQPLTLVHVVSQNEMVCQYLDALVHGTFGPSAFPWQPREDTWRAIEIRRTFTTRVTV